MLIEEVNEKAKRCMHCGIPQCSLKGCPINTKIPDFIQEVKDGNLELAYKILQQNNRMSHICGLVCPQEKQCEGSCIMGIKSEPIEIGKLEAFVNEWAEQNGIIYDDVQEESNGKKIAVVGSGPCGLECSYRLSKKGYIVDVYDKNELPGGVMMYGIPSFRLNKKLVSDICNIMLKGSNFIGNTILDNNLFTKLQKEYDAVFIAIGLEKSTSYDLGQNVESNIVLANDFLYDFSINSNKQLSGKTIVVIGGGNVAMDAARCGIHLGAKESNIFYRRDEEHMPASKKELEEAKKDGVNFCEKIRVIDAYFEDGNFKGINCIKTQIVDGKAIDIENTEFKKECDLVIFAIGQKSNKDLLQELGLELDDYNNIKVDEDYQTSIKGVFAAGDIIGTKATVCYAIKSGRNAAEKIDKFLN